MIAAATLRKGWCPGVLRPMAAGDGLLLRVKPRGNRLTLAAARTVAAASKRFGNGVLTITARANLQLRGASEASLPALTAMLAEAGLLDATPEGEAARNLLSSPLSGCDATAAFDIRPATAALEAALAADPRFHPLPPKFSWNLDDGGGLALADVPGDIRFTAEATSEGPRFRVRLAQDPATGCCDAEHLVGAAAALADAFLALAAAHDLVPHRMADLLTCCDGTALFARAGLPVGGPAASHRPGFAPIGRWDSGMGWVVGAAPAFGRLDWATLDRFATAVGKGGATELRLTPWRGLLVAGLGASAAKTLQAEAADCGLITEAADPRLRIAACAGAPACDRAGAPVQRHAAEWAPLLAAMEGGATQLHVSGCAKGCAHPAAAPLTLVAREGRYDLVRHGRAGDAPTASGLSVAAVAAMVSSLSNAETVS